MTLRRRVLVTALIVALPLALLVTGILEWTRARERRVMLERVMASLQTSIVRDACEADPQWFLAGPRPPRPTAEQRAQPDADVTLPRPGTDELPFEFFAYDERLEPTSTAGPRLPPEMRSALRAPQPAESMIDTYESDAGTGLQMARLTGWTPGPCAALLVRIQPIPALLLQRALVLLGLFALFAAATVLVMGPTMLRVRRLSLAAEQSAKSGYGPLKPDLAHDEISSLAFVFNEGAAEIHRRGEDTRDRIEALRRFVAVTLDEVAAPLASLRQRLAEAALDAQTGSRGGAADGERLAALAREAHDVAMRLQNLAAAARLRMTADPLPREPTDLAAAVRRVVAAYAPLARMSAVTIESRLPDGPVEARADAAWIERALGNVIDNAIRYNRPGGRVAIELQRGGRPGDFSLTIADDGRGVTDDLFQGLTAVRRFRGDESWNRRPNAPGLGIAVAREIADRSGLTLELHRPPQGGFQVVLHPAAPDRSPNV
jgi:signal transduction histidine kinase